MPRCTYHPSRAEAADREYMQTRPARPNALSELWGKDEHGKEVPLHECDITLVTYEGLMQEMNYHKRCDCEMYR